MEITVPEILQCLDLIDSCRLPVLLCQRQVVDVGLTSDETLQHGGIGILGNLQRALGIGDHRLPLVNLCHGLHDIQFGVASLFLTLVRSCLSLTLCREPGIALLAVIDDRHGEAYHHLILHQWTSEGMIEAFSHLVETDRGVNAGVEPLLALQLFCSLSCMDR